MPSQTQITETKNQASPRPLDEWIAYRFGLIAARIGAIGQASYRHKHDLSPAGWRALAVICRYQPCSAAEVSARSRLDPPKVSRAIEALVKAELIQRENDSGDRRRAVLTLTRAGRDIYDDIAARASRFEGYVTATLTKAELAALWKIVEKIDQQIAAYDRPGSVTDTDE